MCDEQSKGEDNPGKPGENAVTPRKNTGDDTGIDGHQGDSGTGGNQPFGNHIQAIPSLFVIHLDKLPDGGAPHRKIYFHMNLLQLLLS